MKNLNKELRELKNEIKKLEQFEIINDYANDTMVSVQFEIAEIEKGLIDNVRKYKQNVINLINAQANEKIILENDETYCEINDFIQNYTGETFGKDLTTKLKEYSIDPIEINTGIGLDYKWIKFLFLDSTDTEIEMTFKIEHPEVALEPSVSSSEAVITALFLLVVLGYLVTLIFG